MFDTIFLCTRFIILLKLKELNRFLVSFFFFIVFLIIIEF